MGKINAKGLLGGAVGPVYFRVLDGKPVMQSKPGKGKVRQAAATQNNASDFGRASRAAKSIRTALFPLLQDKTDAQMYRRFVARVMEAVNANTQAPKGSRLLAGGDLQLLVSFDFNSQSPLGQFTGLRPQMQLMPGGTLRLSMPELLPAAVSQWPDTATHARYCCLVTAFDPQNWQEIRGEMFGLPLAMGQGTATGTVWETAVLPQGSVVFVTVSLQFYRSNSLAGELPLNHKGLHPVGLAGVLRVPAAQH